MCFLHLYYQYLLLLSHQNGLFICLPVLTLLSVSFFVSPWFVFLSIGVFYTKLSECTVPMRFPISSMLPVFFYLFLDQLFALLYLLASHNFFHYVVITCDFFHGYMRNLRIPFCQFYRCWLSVFIHPWWLLKRLNSWSLPDCVFFPIIVLSTNFSGFSTFSQSESSGSYAYFSSIDNIFLLFAFFFMIVTESGSKRFKLFSLVSGRFFHQVSELATLSHFLYNDFSGSIDAACPFFLSVFWLKTYCSFHSVIGIYNFSSLLIT